MSLDSRQVRHINTMCPVGNIYSIGDRLKFLSTSGIYNPAMLGNGIAYFVDNVLGNDNNNGKSWGKAKKTIQSAITASNATIDWSYTPKHYNVIYVKPGVYAENLTPAYYCHVVGCGIPGTDTDAEVHPASGSALTGTLLGAGWFNMAFEVETAVPIFDIGIANNSILQGCDFVSGNAALVTVGVDVENSNGLQILGNRFISNAANMTTGIQFDHGATATADKYAHNVVVRGNFIMAVTAGIKIDVHNVATGCLIQDNVIVRPAKGIDDDNGMSFCISNWISATSDAIEHANSASRCIGNHVIDNVTGAVEASGTD